MVVTMSVEKLKPPREFATACLEAFRKKLIYTQLGCVRSETTNNRDINSIAKPDMVVIVVIAACRNVPQGKSLDFLGPLTSPKPSTQTPNLNPNRTFLGMAGFVAQK